MKALASFVMRGPVRATVILAMASALPLIGIFIGILSSACVGLITLRQGGPAGIKVMLYATLSSGLLMMVILKTPELALVFLLVFWLPIGLLSMLLRSIRSLDFTVQVSVVMGLLVVLLQYLFLEGAPAEYWHKQLTPMAQRFIDAKLLEPSNSEEILKQLSEMMCGVIAVALLMHLLASLFVARWWQAMLYNPGGFAKEFHQLRLHNLIGLLGGGALVSILLPSGTIPVFLTCLGAIFLVPLFLQGLAVVHGVLKHTHSTQLWLVLTYGVLVIFMPQMVLFLIGIGLADIWLDFRARIEISKNG
jgi:hypothetical protein